MKLLRLTVFIAFTNMFSMKPIKQLSNNAYFLYKGYYCSKTGITLFGFAVVFAYSYVTRKTHYRLIKSNKLVSPIYR